MNVIRRRCLKGLLFSSTLFGVSTRGETGLPGSRTDSAFDTLVPARQGIHELVGDVRINRRAALPGQQLFPGDRIQTGRGARLIFVFGEEAFMLREMSWLVLGQGEGSGSAVAGVAKMFLRLVHGGLLAVFGEGEKRLSTPVASIGIRGTACYMELVSDARESGRMPDWEFHPSEEALISGDGQSLYFCLCYGTADIFSGDRQEAQTTIQTRHHDYPIWIHPASGEGQDFPPLRLEKGKVINHNDRELTLLENLCGRWPAFHDQTDPDFIY